MIRSYVGILLLLMSGSLGGMRTFTSGFRYTKPRLVHSYPQSQTLLGPQSIQQPPSYGSLSQLPASLPPYGSSDEERRSLFISEQPRENEFSARRESNAVACCLCVCAIACFRICKGERFS